MVHILIITFIKLCYYAKLMSIVGLSNICYTIKHEIIQNSLRRFPPQRTHRKAIVIPVVVYLQLLRKIFKRIKSVGGVKAFVILAMTALYLPIMPWCKRPDQLVADIVIFQGALKHR